MKLARALRTNLITQSFGQNKLPIYQELGMIAHNGTDFFARDAEPIYWDCTDCEGKVISLSEEEKEGIGVVVITEDKDGIFQHRFWHLKETKCIVGQVLSSGDIIGLADNTGYSTGTHLHRDLKIMGKTKSGKYYKVYPNNGYKGAVDITPYFRNTYIKWIMARMSIHLSILQKILILMKILLNKKI